MNKVLILIFLLILGLFGFALIKRNPFSTAQSTRQESSSENLQKFQGEWRSAPTGETRSIVAEFKGCSLRLVASSEWRRTYSITRLANAQGKRVIVVDGGEDALVYRFDGDEVLWIELKHQYAPDGQTIRFQRVPPTD